MRPSAGIAATCPTVGRCGVGVRGPDDAAGRWSHERHTWGFSSSKKSVSCYRKGIPSCGVSRQGTLRWHQQSLGSAENLFLKVYSSIDGQWRGVSRYFPGWLARTHKIPTRLSPALGAPLLSIWPELLGDTVFQRGARSSRPRCHLLLLSSPCWRGRRVHDFSFNGNGIWHLFLFT